MRASNWSGRGGRIGADHAENNPNSPDPVVRPLACSLYGERRLVHPVNGTALAAIVGVGLDSTTFTSLCCRLRASSWRLVRRTPVSRPSSCHTILSSWLRPFSHRWDCEKPDACTPCWWRSSTRCAAPPWSRSTILRRCSTLRRRGFLVFCVGWCWESDEARLCGRNRAKPNEECRTVD